MPTTVLLAPPDFQTLRRPWILHDFRCRVAILGVQNLVFFCLKKTRFTENLMFFEMEECWADKCWAHCYKINQLKSWSYKEIATLKISLLTQYSNKKISFFLKNQIKFWHSKPIKKIWVEFSPICHSSNLKKTNKISFKPGHF